MATTARWTILSSNVLTPEGTRATVRLRDVPTADGLCPIRPAMLTIIQVLKTWFQVLPIFFPRHSVYTWGSIPLERKVCLPQAVDREVVEEGGQPLRWMLTDRLPYTTQRLGHARPA